MADTTRKRSRKSKLVPRQCPFDEEDLELQVPATKIPKNLKQMTNDAKNLEATTSLFKLTSKLVETSLEATTSSENLKIPEETYDTSVLKKINASARNSLELEETPSRKFEINIEVESCEEDEDDVVKEITENIQPNSPVKEDVVESVPFLKTEEEEETQIAVAPQPINLNLEGILEAVDKLQSSVNIANKILSLYVRNTIGYEQKTKLESHWLENQIQAALDVWSDWHSRSFHRGDPLFYKCYVCKKSYWYLSDFRKHLFSKHTNDKKLYISVERYETHEANLIAYHKELMVIQDIYTPGLCYRCGRDYTAHNAGSRHLGKYYKEDGCPRYFFSCTGLRGHYTSCSVCPVQKRPLKCVICKIGYDTLEEVTEHLILSHSVRSDVPILTNFANNNSELEQEESKYLHDCAKNVLGNNVDCVHDLLSDPKNLLESNKKWLIGTFKCDICGLKMGYSCLKYEHMLSHTDEFMVVKKCTACEGLNIFVNNDEADAHWNLQHKNVDSRDEQNNFHKIFVPWSCVYQSLAKFEQESRPKVQESTTEVQESVAEEQESDVDEKPSIFELEEAAAMFTNQFESTDFKIGDTVIKEEPLDSEDSTGLVIKEEPLEAEEQKFEEEDETQNFGEESETQNLDNQIQVKEEIDEEIDEYDDLIKLDFNLEDLLVEKSGEEREVEETQDSENEYLDNISEGSQDSIVEPKARGKKRRVKKIYKCTCGFEALHKEYRRHLAFNCTKHVYIQSKKLKCTKCNTTFNSMQKYLKHFEDHGYPNLACPECLKEFENYTEMGQHIHMHIRQNFLRVKMITHEGETMGKPIHQCTKCSARIDHPDFFDHWEKHIKARPATSIKLVTKPKPIDAKNGQLKESVMKECIARLMVPTKQCNVCLRHFNRVNECKRHIIEHMLVDAYTQKYVYKELRCQICEDGFQLSDRYKKHMRDHAALPVYKCELCDRTFSDSSNFTKHKKVHNLKVITCDLCGKKFQSKISLEKHLEKHKNTKPIPCNICKKVFYFDSSYRRHVRAYHDKPASEYRCNICGDRFPSLKFKWDHMWEVHEERKHKADCPICHKSFRKFSDVRSHAKTAHMMAITVVGIKTAKPQVAVKIREPTTPGIHSSTWPTLTVGPETETLVIYDSD
ncbi:hypothetical protein PYW08_012196 [Mythimna loreyi]|uniref:Uncharacterized protein n=1 Tax=Mythimna loreyi TaxID=667449 RepID=A0ACC2PZR6_9NEOP|nr:hypothetical protein PYW08_012196 [Mythimna loreyi]